MRRVFVVFKCHLDVGFTDTQANVMRTYFKHYYPQALATTASSRESGANRYVWTTGSWLLFEYLEQATTEERARMEQAVASGDIAWHALPFSWQTEMLDSSMIEGCLGFSAWLDSRFGKRTIAGKMTDVPGHSRGLVPPLAQAGVKLLDIGVNPASTPPDVPDAFLWKEPGGASVAVLYHRHDYGSIIKVPNSEIAVDVEVRGDNSGPHTHQEIDAIYAKLRQNFPHARIIATDFNEVATALAPVTSQLPIVTSEIGDTWIYGAPSDPRKVARYREMARLRREWIAQKRFSVGDATDRGVLRRLALASEHTWGTDTKRYIDHEHYAPKDLAKYLDQPNYEIMEHSWQEKREDVDAGIAALPAALRDEAQGQLRIFNVTAPDLSGLKAADARQGVHAAHFDIALDSTTGALQTLTHRQSGQAWASAEHPLALFTYQTLNQADYTAFLNTYVRSKAWWAPQDFGKPNIGKLDAASRDWHPRVRRLWAGETPEAHRIVAELAISDPVSEQRGLVAWPAEMYLELILPKAQPVVHLSFTALKKAPNRMPEAMWLTFNPVLADGTWTLEKVNRPVSPADVVRGGGRAMHAVTENIHYEAAGRTLELRTLDAPVVAFGRRSPLNFTEALPDFSKGIHVCLYNNAWGTNYPQWAGCDWLYRFCLRF